MRKKPMLKRIIALVIFLAIQTLSANTIFADPLINNTYIVTPWNTGGQNAISRPFSVKNIEETGFNVIEKTLRSLARRQMAIYDEYLLPAHNTQTRPEALQRIYVERMRKTSQTFIAYLRKALSSYAAKEGKSLARISQDEHTIKALFLLDRETPYIR